jgi:aspartyl-tRNA(Asn)/glutamyl-tRNA(Gln) amidotransferase subunit A
MRVRPLVQAELGQVFRRVDILMCPTTSRLAPPVDGPKSGGDGSLRSAGLTRLFSVAGVPAIAVPCGFSAAGLPLSFQLVGRPFDEPGILRVGAAYQAATDWHTRRPPVASAS